jgi:mannose-1-phosphate guanylyltransferase
MIQTLRDYCLDGNHCQNLDSSPVHLWAVLLAGGDGVRLRDLTRRIAGDSRPKQFCRIVGELSLLRETRTRLNPLFIRDRQVFIFSRASEQDYGDELTDAGDSCVLEQPLNRGTGIAIILALLRILQCDHDALAAFFPCDHFYADHDSFHLTIRSAVECAEHNPDRSSSWAPTLSIPRPIMDGLNQEWLFRTLQERRFHGYLDFGRSLHCNKPMRYYAGGCFWNTFVTVGRATTFFEMLCSQVPEAALVISRAMADNTLNVAYASLDTVDFSGDVLANLPRRLLVLRDRTSGWADLGSPIRVLDTLSRNGIQPEWVEEMETCVFDHQEQKQNGLRD